MCVSLAQDSVHVSMVTWAHYTVVWQYLQGGMVWLSENSFLLVYMCGGGLGLTRVSLPSEKSNGAVLVALQGPLREV